LLTGRGDAFLVEDTKDSLNEPSSKYQEIKFNTKVKTNLIGLLLEDKEVKEILQLQLEKLHKKDNVL
jgi:hypothetical protein